MNQPSVIELKRGDTLDLGCTVQAEGVPLDITGWQIDCWVRAPGGRLVHRFAVEVTDPAQGEYSMAASSAETTAWPPGKLTADIRYADAAGRVMHTCDLIFAVADSPTIP